jgi:3-hydroxyacyl-CoA dehydrogenase
MSLDGLIRRAAVLGAGVMGAQIAAHLANAGVAVALFDLPAKSGDSRAVARQAIKRLLKLEPKPLASPACAALIQPADYEHDLPALGECQLVIEAIAERLDWKRELYAKIAPHLGERAVLASNTSGLSIASLSEVLPATLRPRFCGVHFFNPPRYMALVELIQAPQTHAGVLDRLEAFLTSTLGKGVIRAKDTPNFIANRIGVFSIAATLHHAEEFGLAPDLVDALTGPAIGRPKSATYRTADVVGLDTLRHVIEGSAKLLTNDPWVEYLSLPPWLTELIDSGAIGQKVGAGIYRKQGKTIQVFDQNQQQYRAAAAEVAAEVTDLLTQRDPGERLAALRASDHPQAAFLWAIHRDVFHYAAHWLEEIADTARDLDLAIRWGFGWSMGPLEIWQAAGWRQVTGWINEDIDAGRSLSATPLPGWVAELEAVHRPDGSWSAAEQRYKARAELAVYARQRFPERVLGEAESAPGKTLFDDAGGRLWSDGDDVLILSLKSKMHTLGSAVLEALDTALRTAETRGEPLVIWHPAPFSAGADLKEFGPAGKGQTIQDLEEIVSRFQRSVMGIRDASVPVVAAVQGLALGGGCELLMHCDRVVAALESYIGLPEVGVGLLPAGGGSKELARRAAERAGTGDIFPHLKAAFETIAMGHVCKSAIEARERGFLRATDVILFNSHELLFVARSEARALAARGYRPPTPLPFRVMGREALGNLELALLNMREGGFISEHDFLIGRKVAEVLCGGNIDPLNVDEEWLLAVERKAFLELARTDASQARMAHLLETGKPLRN